MIRDPTPSFAAADSAIERATASGRIPGAVLHVRAAGRVVHERVFGRRQAGEAALLPADALFAIASLTKPVVAAAVLQLCERGRLSLDDLVERHLPEFAEPKVLVSYDVATAVARTRPARRSITIRDLLTHTAGIHHGFVSSDSPMGLLYERAGVVHDARQLLDEKIRRLGPLPLVHDPGAGWTYGLSSDVGGRVVEVVSGVPLDRYLVREIFEPLGMRTTTYAVAPDLRPRVAVKHVRAADGGLTPMAAWAHADPHVSGGGGLHTTAADYGRFAQALLDGGAPILRPESARAMTGVQTPHVTSLGLRYGLSVGLATRDARGNHPLPVGGFGWYGIFSTWFWAWPHAVVLLFSHVLDVTMSFPLFSEVTDLVARALRAEERR